MVAKELLLLLLNIFKSRLLSLLLLLYLHFFVSSEFAPAAPLISARTAFRPIFIVCVQCTHFQLFSRFARILLLPFAESFWHTWEDRTKKEASALESAFNEAPRERGTKKADANTRTSKTQTVAASSKQMMGLQEQSCRVESSTKPGFKLLLIEKGKQFAPSAPSIFQNGPLKNCTYFFKKGRQMEDLLK